VLNYIHGFALVAAFIGLWLGGWYVLTWLLYGLLSLFPFSGQAATACTMGRIEPDQPPHVNATGQPALGRGGHCSSRG
jgi:hypothetical protein